MTLRTVGRISRRSLIVGAGGIAGAATVGAITPFTAFGQAATPVRQDIVSFAKNATKLASFEGAVKEMQDRSRRNAGDPKGWLINANMHRDFCSIPQSSSKQIHFCYWFLSWHRAYIHVTELKVRELSGDKTLCYPYWNWSTDRRIPAAYAKAGSSLSNAVRFTPNRALSDGEVDYNPNDPTLKKLGVSALATTEFEAKTPDDIQFTFGGIARPNQSNAYTTSRLEGTPHGPIHVYVGGNSRQGQPGDMSVFDTAGRDPIFFAHHGNLDRLWEIWRQDPARKATEPKTAAFLNHKFVFTWLDGAPMQVSVADTLDTKKLNYVYDNLDVMRPGAPIVVAAQSAEGNLPPIATENLRAPLTAQAAGEKGRKILQITNVEPPKRPMTVSVYIKPADAPKTDLGINVGSFSAVLTGNNVMWPMRTLSFDITAAVDKYAGQQITVSLIPLRVQPSGSEEYANLKYGAMRIITRK
jgi:polyphenol oxidase